MTNLKCTTANCVHNLKCHCNAGVVTVDERGLCDTKIKRAGGALEQTFREIEAGDDFIPDAPLSVECTADCVYNKDNVCTASAIYVNDSFARTKCATRQKS